MDRQHQHRAVLEDLLSDARQDDVGLYEVLHFAGLHAPQLTRGERLELSMRVVQELLDAALIDLYWSDAVQGPAVPLQEAHVLVAASDSYAEPSSDTRHLRLLARDEH